MRPERSATSCALGIALVASSPPMPLTSGYGRHQRTPSEKAFEYRDRSDFASPKMGRNAPGAGYRRYAEGCLLHLGEDDKMSVALAKRMKADVAPLKKTAADALDRPVSPRRSDDDVCALRSPAKESEPS